MLGRVSIEASSYLTLILTFSSILLDTVLSESQLVLARRDHHPNLPDKQLLISAREAIRSRSERDGHGRKRRFVDTKEYLPTASILGIRCNEGSEMVDGELVIKAHEMTDIHLFGHKLDTSLVVGLTTRTGWPNDDCTNYDRVKSMPLQNVSSSVARISVQLASPGLSQAYYLCLHETFANGSSRWRHQGDEPWLRFHVRQDWLPLYMKIIVIACLLLLSGLFSGLNLGLMALDKHELQVIISCGSETEKRYARAIEPVRRRGNYLLCSILFSNVLINSTIAVLLEELTSGIVAVITSTVFIVMFGEILPQAFCSRHGLAVGANTVLITHFCMIVTFPLSYPVSFCLDWALGEEIGHAYDRERLMEFIRVTRDYNNLEPDEFNIISGALKLKKVHVSEVMTRIEDVFMIDIQSRLDFDTIQAIVERGYSRIPVHEANNRKNIIALLFAKDLALLDPDDKTPVQILISFYDHYLIFLFEDDPLDLALNLFKTGKSHMAFVRRIIDDGDGDPVYEITGIVTLEDVIEEIMQMEINDETDTLTDNRRKRRRKDAQLRRDFSQFARLGGGDNSFNVVATPQLCLAAYQFLSTNIEPLARNRISDLILKRLLSQKIYHKVRRDEERGERRLYTAGEAADYFIMILEGHVSVKCGREKLLFEAGPFSCFGKSALVPDLVNQQLYDTSGTRAAKRLERRRSSANLPTTPRTLTGQFSISMRKLEQSLEENLPVLLPLASRDESRNVEMTEKESELSLSLTERIQGKFVPDYSVEVVGTVSYLKITRTDYLSALKATLVERGIALREEEEIQVSKTANQIEYQEKTHSAGELHNGPLSTGNE